VNFTTSTSGSYPTRSMTLTGTYTLTPLVSFIPFPTSTTTTSMTMMFELQQ
jgi:hypothetical protein